MTPIECYKKDLENAEFIADPAQQKAVEFTQALYEDLVSGQRRNIFTRFVHSFLQGRTTYVKGLYLWGGVGRGKTYLVDTFYACLPFENKMRMHFHRFMQKVHGELKLLKQIRDPLQVVAGNFARQAKVICFDEFHVADITDAMLLGGLLKTLFDRGVVLVATSNEYPDQLYSGGLQRERFIPAIELIKQHTHVIHVDGGTDHRLRYLDKAEIYHCPLDESAERILETNFIHIAPDMGRTNSTIEIEGRKIPAVRHADGVIWFDFYTLCDGPRGPADYIEIGRQFQTVLIANVPQMDDMSNDLAKRFITLVDEFYDRHVKLILTAAVQPNDLYQGNRLTKPFSRTISRLIEMQSHDYLARQHLSD